MVALVLLSMLRVFALAAEEPDALLSISREGSMLRAFSMANLEALEAVVMTVEDDAGNASEYAGVPISRLLESAGVGLGKSVSGARLTEYVVVRARDGYRVLFSLAEIDPAFRQRTLLICYRKNGAALPAKEGPLRMVVADEKRHARWVRRVDSIELGSAGASSGPR